MTNREAYNSGTEKLKQAGIAEAEIDAFLLWEYVTGKSKADFLLNAAEQMLSEYEQKFSELIKRREKREPCQYIIGTTEFMGLEFTVTSAVLIPRQDTEVLAEAVIETLKEKYEQANPRVLDLCTGSGALAVSIKHYVSGAKVSASDISKDALNVAKQNAAHNGTNIEFIESDMFQNIDGTFDIIVSNPPYVTEDEYKELMPEVKKFEPKLALTAGSEGLDFYKIIAKEAADHLEQRGWLMLEIGCTQGNAVSSLLKDNGFINIEIKKDLTGLQRVVIGRKA